MWWLWLFYIKKELIHNSCLGGEKYEEVNQSISYENNKVNMTPIKGANMNAFSTPKSLKPGVNDKFMEFLTNFELNNSHREVLRAQLMRQTQTIKMRRRTIQRLLKMKMTKLEQKLENVNEKFLMSDSVNQSEYIKIKKKLEGQIQSMQHKFRNLPEKLSNHEKLMDKALHFCQNLSDNWASGDIHPKILIQKTLFPGSLVIKPETGDYRTKEANSLISAIASIAREENDSKNKKATLKGGFFY